MPKALGSKTMMQDIEGMHMMSSGRMMRNNTMKRKKKRSKYAGMLQKER